MSVFSVHSMLIIPLGLISAEYTPDTLESYSSEDGGDDDDGDDDEDDDHEDYDKNYKNNKYYDNL